MTCTSIAGRQFPHCKLSTPRARFTRRMVQTGCVLGLWLLAFHSLSAAEESFTIVPAAPGAQCVRVSVPLPRGFLHPNEHVVVTSMQPDSDVRERVEQTIAPRVITWYPDKPGEDKSARRALVTFPWTFTDVKPVIFSMRTTTAAATSKPTTAAWQVSVEPNGSLVKLTRGGTTYELRLVAPPRQSEAPPKHEQIEHHAQYRWDRWQWDDPQWSRRIETRVDLAGQIVVVAHLQRTGAVGDFAPEIAWELSLPHRSAQLRAAGQAIAEANGATRHSFADGVDASCLLDDSTVLYHPSAASKRRGGIELRRTDDQSWSYRYTRCRADDRVPQQPYAWQRAELVIAPTTLAPLTASLSSPHLLTTPLSKWQTLYGELHDSPALPADLQKLVAYHRDAVVRSLTLGDDFGNVTGYADGVPHGSAFGMNRLNHGAAIFEDAWRSGDRRLRETALLWCDNFYDQSIWWGAPERGGTRYNNIIAQQQTPPTNHYMWRSNSSVSFCTKGYDCFFLSWEETGDPRALEALQAQTDYASKHLHAYQTTCRNVGDVRDFVRLYEFTGDRRYLDESLRLFRELRTRLSPDHLFDEGGKPLDLNPPFIEDDQRGISLGYAKPYIIGYALAGLPELIEYAPDEPDLKETVRAVADFLARTVDPVGGWRYPHPRSSFVLMNQSIEHAWQLTQAARVLGPEQQWLDAIETVLRARLHGWRRTGRILSGLEGWEVSTGQVKTRAEINQLYQKPTDRDPSRDYREGTIGWGSAPPEGLVYFEEVLGFYLRHRSVERLMVEPKPDEPLGQVLSRAK